MGKKGCKTKNVFEGVLRDSLRAIIGIFNDYSSNHAKKGAYLDQGLNLKPSKGISNQNSL